ncbi:MAG: hypothetical protein II677_04520 [Muribaculaceae bacterium]|nr:hypothetical protein [Muribaculaceae bacterium]
MKRWPVILIALSLLTALLVGCGRSHDARVTAQLDRADSLLRTSATALVRFEGGTQYTYRHFMVGINAKK